MLNSTTWSLFGFSADVLIFVMNNIVSNFSMNIMPLAYLLYCCSWCTILLYQRPVRKSLNKVLTSRAVLCVSSFEYDFVFLFRNYLKSTNIGRGGEGDEILGSDYFLKRKLVVYIFLWQGNFIITPRRVTQTFFVQVCWKHDHSGEWTTGNDIHFVKIWVTVLWDYLMHAGI